MKEAKMTTSHLVCLFCVTAGQNGENLGSDEEQIVLIVYVLYDITNNKVITLHTNYVRPTLGDSETKSDNVLTEECRIQTSLLEDNIRNAQPLEHVLDDIERFLCSKAVHPDHGGRQFTFCTDGQLHLRMCLLAEATRKNIPLPSHFYRFFDLRKEFRKFYNTDRPINCIRDMLDFLGIEGDQTLEYGVRHCQQMTLIIQRLINDGHVFLEPDIIKDKLEPGVCGKDDAIDDETVVRARGLPWQSSDQDIARFFRGLNVARGGVALCLSQQGRRNGEALVRFDSKEHRDLALRKHKHHIGQRYIEVYRATGQDFLAVAGGSSSEAREFLSRHCELDSQVIIRMRGLPYTCTAQQVLEFFKLGLTPVDVLDGEDGILFVHQADGRATGDAFVLFSNDEHANKALTKHRQCIGTRYIELFKSTTAEVQQVLNRSLDPRASTIDSPDLSPIPILSHMAPNGIPNAVIFQQQLITCGSNRDCLRVRGLPMEATVADILAILGECAHSIALQGVHLVYNSMGIPSGEAFIQMDSEYSAEVAATTKNRKMFIINNKKRYIEVLQCSGDDMNVALNTGLTSSPPPLPVAVASSPALQSPMTVQAIQNTPILLPPPTHIIPTQMTRPVMSQVSTVNTALLAAPGSFPGGPMQYQPSPAGAGTQQMMQNASVPAMSPANGQINAFVSMPPTLFATQNRPPQGTIFQSPQPTFTTYQPIIYVYPSPPMSPQNTYYIQAYPTTVLMKGLPANTQPNDLLAFIDGLVEIMPDIQFVHGSDGRPSGEAYVTFGSRIEADRVIGECSRKLLGNSFIDMQMII